ncbi:LexA family transcriptional regulator [Pseudomonas sp. LP_7_YM]|uniref:LexA family protein n=1 Tax=Pseudomonas sp. LP_7_YM TaxID=2485137 RepID=UPI001060BE76|nr:S24 family peptidase [Pseudomonas sp. LP_7_YM]TDV67554.1 DNA polymerase V [Pseudomonas sp. LP_7_YM]
MTLTILGPLVAGGERLPLYSSHAQAGFPFPAADHVNKHTSFDDLFDIRAPHIYLVRIEGDSMQGAGIFCGDLVIVDRSLYAEHGDIVVASLNTEPVCKRLHMRGPDVILTSENPQYPPRYVLESDDLMIWGVVKHSIRAHENSPNRSER